MVLMALDHVRVYSAVPAGGPEPAIFFTRWVTHFCAPAFLFLAGSSAWLRAQQKPGLSRWLFTRGLLLVALELVAMRFFWTFNSDVRHYLLAGVLWVIGWCFVCMALLVRLPRPAVGLFGLAIVLFHNAAAPWLFQAGPLLYGIGVIGPLAVLYSLIPWLGVMAMGYGFAPYLANRRVTLLTGAAAVALFVLLRATDTYGDPRLFRVGSSSALLRFLNTTKYPASLQFLLMTLGPLLLLVPWAERAQGRLAEALRVFGRVPLFFYVLHIPLAHLLALAVSAARGQPLGWLFANHPMSPGPAPEGFQWPLWLLYAVTALLVALLYPMCTWVQKKRKYPSSATASPMVPSATPAQSR